MLVSLQSQKAVALTLHWSIWQGCTRAVLCGIHLCTGQPCLLQEHHQGIAAALALNPAHLQLVQVSCSCFQAQQPHSSLLHTLGALPQHTQLICSSAAPAGQEHTLSGTSK